MSVSSVGTQLAVLILETQQAQKEVDRELLAGARRDYSEAVSSEVQALRDQADATFRGALFEGGASIVSGGLGVWGATRECPHPWQESASKGVGGLAKPLGAAVGHTYGGADAKAAQGAGQQASWEIEDLKGNLNDADQAQDKALDWSSSLIDADAATTRAVLSNMA